jgi:hypothetical protein
MNQQTLALDIFLRRSHALPIPYLLAPSLSFLVYVSPLAYLSMLREAPKPLPNQPPQPLPLDVPLQFLRSKLSQLPNGATLATLVLARVSIPSLPSSMHVSTFATRPTFPLGSGSDIDYTFPQIVDEILLSDEPGSGLYEWVLDFTANGKTEGVVVSQSRMREIELVLNPLGGMGSMDVMTTLQVFRGKSWVDLLVCLTRSPAYPMFLTIYAPAEPQ